MVVTANLSLPRNDAYSLASGHSINKWNKKNIFCNRILDFNLECYTGDW